MHIVKRREFIRIVNRAFGGRVPSFSPWKTIGRFNGLAEAQARKDQETHKPGLFQCEIFYNGRKLQ